MDYFKTMRGTTQSPPGVGLAEVAWSWVGAFLGIALVGLVGAACVDRLGQGLLIGSFGAAAKTDIELIVENHPRSRSVWLRRSAIVPLFSIVKSIR